MRGYIFPQGSHSDEVISRISNIHYHYITSIAILGGYILVARNLRIYYHTQLKMYENLFNED